jgi:hypothetical protein
MEPGDGQIAFESREVVWAVLGPLTSDPEPTPEFEAKYGGSNMDAATLSINTTRGCALHAVVRYVLWVRGSLLASGTDASIVGLDQIPEAKAVLENHLLPAVDPSVTIRSIYGRWFPQLVLADTNWASANFSAIFPESEVEAYLFESAWEAYVTFNPPYDQVVRLLWPAYSRSLERMCSPTTSSSAPERGPQTRFAQHFAAMSAYGWTSPGPGKALHDRFYGIADDEFCALVIRSVGHSLRPEGHVSSNILSHLQAFWALRLTSMRASPAEHSQELAAFEWWAISNRFPANWTVANLVEVLRLGAVFKLDGRVIEYIASVEGIPPADRVEALRLVVEADREHWRIGAYQQAAADILKAAIGCGDRTARTAAVDLVHSLGRKGHQQFRSLLPS